MTDAERYRRLMRRTGKPHIYWIKAYSALGTDVRGRWYVAGTRGPFSVCSDPAAQNFVKKRNRWLIS